MSETERRSANISRDSVPLSLSPSLSLSLSDCLSELVRLFILGRVLMFHPVILCFGYCLYTGRL